MDEELTGYKQGWMAKLVAWQKEHISDKQMTLILAFLIGLLASVAGFFLHAIVHEIQFLLTSGFEQGTYNLLFLLFPIVGIYLTSLFIKYVVRDNISHGITRVLYAISTKNSKLRGHNCWSSVVASGITIGFGGSVGAEAPIVLTGSAIGSNLGQIFRMDKKTMILLVGCGASAAIAGIFKAPIAGLVFTLEVLMVDLSMASLLPILISCVTATCFTYILMGSKSLFDFTLTSPWVLDRAPVCILLGIFCGFVSLYFMRTMSACEGMFARLGKHPYAKLLLGGLILSSLIFSIAFAQRNQLHRIIEVIEHDDVLIHDIIDIRRIILLHGGILHRDILEISHGVEGGEAIESAEILALAFYVEALDEIVDGLGDGELALFALALAESRQRFLLYAAIRIGLDDLAMTHGDACQRMHTDEGARILGAMIVGTLHQSRLGINISQSHIDSHRRIEVSKNLAGYCLIIKLCHFSLID